MWAGTDLDIDTVVVSNPRLIEIGALIICCEDDASFTSTLLCPMISILANPIAFPNISNTFWVSIYSWGLLFTSVTVSQRLTQSLAQTEFCSHHAYSTVP